MAKGDAALLRRLNQDLLYHQTLLAVDRRAVLVGRQACKRIKSRIKRVDNRLRRERRKYAY